MLPSSGSGLGLTPLGVLDSGEGRGNYNPVFIVLNNRFKCI